LKIQFWKLGISSLVIRKCVFVNVGTDQPLDTLGENWSTKTITTANFQNRP